jgi:hypothetical protein
MRDFRLWCRRIRSGLLTCGFVRAMLPSITATSPGNHGPSVVPDAEIHFALQHPNNLLMGC